MTKVYVCDDVRAGQQLIGWDAQSLKLVVTTPIVDIQPADKGNQVAKTEEGGEYLVTRHK